MKTSERLDRLPPYLFAELERKISEKRAQGIDVISLGIGDPDTPSPQPVVDALRLLPLDLALQLGEQVRRQSVEALTRLHAGPPGIRR